MIKNDAVSILSKNIRKMRKSKKMTQAMLAERINKTVEMVCQLENGVSSTKITTLNDIADVFGVEVYQLFMETPLLAVNEFSPEMTEVLHELQDQNTPFVKAVLGLLKTPKD